MASNTFGLDTFLHPSFDKDYPASIDFVEIHGLRGSSHFSHIDTNSALRPFKSQSRLSLYSYDIWGSNGGIFTRSGAIEEATKFLDALVRLRSTDSKKGLIVFIAHDIGGSFLKEALVLSQNQKYEDIYTSIWLLGLFDCPDGGQSKVDFQSAYANILMSHKKMSLSETWELTGHLAEWTVETNNVFAETRISISVSVIHLTSSYSDLKQLFPDKSLTSTHLTAEDLHDSGLLHKEFLSHWGLEQLRSNHDSLDDLIDSNALTQCRKLLLQAPPRYPLETPSSGEESLDSITSHEDFQGWVNADKAKILLIHTPDDNIETAERIYDCTAKLLDSLGFPMPVSLFIFDAMDCRYNSAEAFLFDRLAGVSPRQYLEEKPRKVIINAMKYLEICNQHHLEDIYAVVCDLIIQNLAEVREAFASEVILPLVLGNLDDKIQNGSWLFGKLQETFADCDLKFKIVIASSRPASLVSDSSLITTLQLTQDSEPVPQKSNKNTNRSAAEEGESTDNQSQEKMPEKQEDSTALMIETNQNQENTMEKKEDPGFLATEANQVKKEATVLPLELLNLIQKRPQLYSYTPLLSKLIQSCGKDGYLQRMITSWLRVVELPDNDQLNSFLSELIPATPSKIFDSILTSIPFEACSWSISLIDRAMFAFRPLTLAELLDLEIQERPLSNSSNMKEQIEKVLGGLLIIRRREVHPGHVHLRDYLLTPKPDAYGGLLLLKAKVFVHKHIADSCLGYLTSFRGRKLMRERTSTTGSRHTTFESRDNFLSYSVKYWLKHAKQAAQEGSFKTDACRRFIDDEDTVKLWAMAYRTLSTSMTKEEEESCGAVSSLAIFAENEAEELLISGMSRYRESTTFSTACFDALVAAAAVGNIRMVKELMKIPPPEIGTLDKPIVAAIESGDTDVFAELISVARKVPEKVKDFPALLARAASLGRKTAVEDLLSLIKTSESSAYMSNGVSPLSYACQRGFVEVVELLIRNGADAVAEDSSGNTPVTLAVKFGQLEVLHSLNHLIPKLLEDPIAIRYYSLVIEASYRFGRRKPVKSIIADIMHKLEVGIDTSMYPESLGFEKGHGSRNLVDYLAQEILGEPLFSDAVGEAIQNRYFDLIDILTQAEGRVDQKDFSSFFADWIEKAVKTGDPKVVMMVFENGVKSGMVTEENLAPTATRALRAAILHNLPDCVPFLIEKGADITSRDASGTTPLYDATYSSKVKVVKALIDAHVDVNATGDGTWSAIHAAFDNPEIANMLITAKADVDALTDSGNSAMWFAVKWGHGKVVDELLKGNPGRATLQEGLKAAILYNHPSIAETILLYCPDSSYLPDTDDLLHRQVRRSNKKLLELLLDYNVDPNKRDSDTDTALHYVVEDTNVEVVKLLVKRGANIEITNDIGETPLYTAVRESNLEVLRYLVEQGALINTTGAFYGSPFHAACYEGTLEMVKALSASQIDPVDVDLVDAGVMGTPLQAALQQQEVSSDRQDIVKYLVEEAGAQINLASSSWGGAFFLACLTSSLETMRMLIGRGAEVNAKDYLGRTPLHFALYRTREHVELLLAPEQAADIDEVDMMQRHALHFAVVSGRLDLVKFVIEKRPDLVNQKDIHDWTPLLWAVRITENWGIETDEKKEIIQELLEHGAGRLVRGQGLDCTWTPLKLAHYYKLPKDVVDMVHPTAYDLESDEGRSWDWKSTGGKRGLMNESKTTYCDACLMMQCGVYYDCTQCKLATSYCFKCYQSKDELHPLGHDFNMTCNEEEDEDADEFGDDNSLVERETPKLEDGSNGGDYQVEDGDSAEDNDEQSIGDDSETGSVNEEESEDVTLTS